MEGGRDMERIREQLSTHDRYIIDHEKRIKDLESGGKDQMHKVELLSLEVKGMTSQFAELKAAVKEDGTKTRESIQDSEKMHTAQSQRMTDFFMKQFETLQASGEAAVTFERDIKRTKLQIFRDIMLAALAGGIAIQELVAWVAKNF